MAFEIKLENGISVQRDLFGQSAGKNQKNSWPKAFGKSPESNGKKEEVLKRLGKLKINPTVF